MELKLDLENVETTATSDIKKVLADSERMVQQTGKELVLTSIAGDKLETKRITDIIMISPDHKQIAEAGAAEFDIYDDIAISTFSVAPQKAYMEQLKNLLGGAQIRDLGQQGGNIIKGLDESVEMVDFEKIKDQLLSGKSGRLFGLLKGAYEKFVADRQKIVSKVNSLEGDINGAIESLTEDVFRMKEMYNKVENNFYQLGIYIYTGELILEKAKAEYDRLANMELDPVAQGKLDQLYENVMAFNQRMLRIKTAYVHAPVKLKEIRMQITATRQETDNMIEALTFDLPAFLECLNQIVGLKKVLDAQKNRNAMIERRKKMEDVKGEMLDHAATAAKDGALTGIEEVDRIAQQIGKVADLTKRLSGLDERNMELQRKAETALVNVSQEFNAAMKEHNKANKLG